MCADYRIGTVILILACIYHHCGIVNAGGTTRNIKDIFIGRCFEYQRLSTQNKIDVLKTNLNCTKVWNAFYNSFAKKDPCDITKDSYKLLFDMLDVKQKIDNSLFWSGAHELVTQFTFINDDYIALEDTFTGHMFNNLNWCGSETSADGFNHTHCNSSGKKCNSMYYVWFLASEKFAERATGVTHVLLNASRTDRTAYYKDSFFRSVEMPRLNITKLVVYVASNIGETVRETCTSASLIELKADAMKKKLQLECIDQPKLVLRIFCIKYPTAKECKGPNTSAQKHDNETKLWKTISFIFITVAVILIILIAATIGQYNVKKKLKFKDMHKWSISRKPILGEDDDEMVAENNNDIVLL